MSKKTVIELEQAAIKAEQRAKALRDQAKRQTQMEEDRFYDEVSSLYDMERGEQRQPEETKAHTTKREWEIVTQENKIDDLQMQKELLEFYRISLPVLPPLTALKCL